MYKYKNIICEKMDNIFLIISLFMIIITCYSLDSSAETLKKVKIDVTPAGDINFYYNPKFCNLLLEDVTNNSKIKTIRVAKVFLSNKKNEEIIIEYSEGGSVDPGFIFYSHKNSIINKISNLIDGLNISIPGNGNIYIWGHINSYFNKKKKFILKDEMITEVKQPYYYVGLDSFALKELVIYNSKNLSEIQEKIEENDPVTILLNDNELYLLKTKYDTVGWWKPEEFSYFESKEIEGFYMKGD